MYDFLEMFNVNFLQRSELIIEIQIRLNILDLDLYQYMIPFLFRRRRNPRLMSPTSYNRQGNQSGTVLQRR